MLSKHIEACNNKLNDWINILGADRMLRQNSVCWHNQKEVHERTTAA
jgi:hypothetical protein